MQLTLSEQSVMNVLPEFVVVDGKKIRVVEQRGYYVRGFSQIDGEMVVLPLKSIAESVFKKCDESIVGSVSKRLSDVEKGTEKKFFESILAGRPKIIIDAKRVAGKDSGVQGFAWVKESKKQFEHQLDVLCSVVSETEDRATFKVTEGTAFGNATTAIVFLNEDVAAEYVSEIVKKDLVENTDLFSPSFVSGIATMFDTDRKKVAAACADRIVESMDNDTVCCKAGQDFNETYQEFLDEELISDKSDEVKAKIDDVVAEARRAVREEVYATEYVKLGDPVKYFVETGVYTVSEAVALPSVMVDLDGAAKKAIDVEGVGAFIDGYVGTKVMFENGAVAFLTK